MTPIIDDVAEVVMITAALLQLMVLGYPSMHIIVG
jgi:hypothetical protein